MSIKINPVGLKGQELTERMRKLMGMAPINENKKASAVELTKVGPDGNVYAIIRENHEYYIKKTDKKENLKIEDFQYIGGLQNKKQEVYPTYAKAIKQLNLKFNSLNEVYGKSGQVNVFKSDNLLNEGFYDAGMAEYDKPAMGSFQKQYGDEKGKNIYYATANKQDRDPETFEKNEGMGIMDEQGESTISVKKISSKGASNIITGVPILDTNTYPFPLLIIKNQDGGKPMLRLMLDDKYGFINADESGSMQPQYKFEPVDNNSEQWFNKLKGGQAVNGQGQGMMDELSSKQKDIAKLDGDPDEFDAADLAALRAGKRSDEGYLDEIDMNEYEDYIDGMIDDGFRPNVDLGSSFDKMKPQSTEPTGFDEKKPSFLSKLKDKAKNIFDNPNDDKSWESDYPELDFKNRMGYDPLSMTEEKMTDKKKKFAALAEPKDKITYADKIAGAKKGEEESDDENQNESLIDEIEALLEASNSLLKKKH